jgi:hypothetical protein
VSRFSVGFGSFSPGRKGMKFASLPQEELE